MMSFVEFKAWLEGYEEALGGKPPSADQWKVIKGRLSKVTEKVVQYDLPRGWNDPVRRIEVGPVVQPVRYT